MLRMALGLEFMFIDSHCHVMEYFSHARFQNTSRLSLSSIERYFMYGSSIRCT